VPETGFQAGRARVCWNASGLIYDVILLGSGQRNEARRLNELTWERGDVCEIFLQDTATRFYIELHVTPENQRLQLRFPLGAIDAVRDGQAPLENLMVSQPDWVETSTDCGAGFFKVRAVIPARTFSSDAVLSNASQLRTAVCRYDYRAAAHGPLLSSTAPFAAPSFHCPAYWTPLALRPARTAVFMVSNTVISFDETRVSP
jgi:hypothetical protein